METNEGFDAARARDALAEIDSAQRAVRDTPWPTWLYPVNALLLGATGLTYLYDGSLPWPTLAAAAVVIGVNLWAGRLTGVPFALPTSRPFLALVVVSGLCLVGCAVVASAVDDAWPVVGLSVAAALSYALASWVHVRSTRR